MAIEKGLVSAARGWPLAILLAVPPLYSELVPRVLAREIGYRLRNEDSLTSPMCAKPSLCSRNTLPGALGL